MALDLQVEERLPAMKWPWVSRLLYEQLQTHYSVLRDVAQERLEIVQNENQRLRDQNEKLIDHVTRMDRVEHGKAEQPRVPRPAIEAMPKEIREHIKGFASSSVQAELRNELFNRHRQGTPWNEIWDELRKKDGPETP